MDSLKQKNNESMVDYISRINTLKDQLFGVQKDAAEQAAILTKLGKKAYSGMNEKSDAKYRSIIITRGAKNDFVKIKAIIDEHVRDDQIRWATRGENDDSGEGKAMSASGPSNHRKPSKELGLIVPGKLYITNIKYTMTIDALKSIFAKFGTVDDVDIINARGRPLGFGFVTFKNAVDDESARKVLNGKELEGRKIGVVEYRSRKKDGSAGMARGEDDAEFETGSAMSVALDDEVDDGFDITDHEYIDWNYGLALLSSGLPDLSTNSSITGLIDSGCSNNLSPHHLPGHRNRSNPIRFSTADGQHMYSTGDRGSVSGYANTDNIFQLRNVHHVPQAKQTLISVHQLLLSGHDVWFDRSDMSVNVGNLDDRTTVAKDYARHGVFPLTIRNNDTATAHLSRGILLPPNVSWHKRMFHLNHEQLKATQAAVNGMNLPPHDQNQHCEECVLGKMHQYPHRTISEKDNRLLGVVSLDLVFPPKHIPSLGGATCFLGISVRSCGFKFGYALKRKSDVAEYLDYARKYLERQTGEKLMEWHMDAAGEHKSKILQEACNSLGITITYTGTEEHQQQAEIEGWFRVAFDGFRSHAIGTKAPLNLWADGIHTYCYVCNRTIHGKDTKTPYEQIFKRKPTVADIRVLFCLAYVRTLPKDRVDGKLNPRAVKGRFIGMGMYDGQPIKTRGYRILRDDNDANSVIISSDVYFVENVFNINVPVVEVPVTRWSDHHDENDFDIFRGKGEPQGQDELPPANMPATAPILETETPPTATERQSSDPPSAD
jgi:RNA recognition motif-containing protein